MAADSSTDWCTASGKGISMTFFHVSTKLYPSSTLASVYLLSAHAVLKILQPSLFQLSIVFDMNVMICQSVRRDRLQALECNLNMTTLKFDHLIDGQICHQYHRFGY